MSIHEQYRRDRNTAWVSPTGGIEIEVKHFDPRSAEYVNTMTKITKPVRKLVEHNALPPEKDREYAIKTFVRVAVRGWRTVMPAGETEPETYRWEINIKEDEWLPFTEDNAVTVFMAYPQFYNDTVELARDLTSFQVSDEERKNSQTV